MKENIFIDFFDSIKTGIVITDKKTNTIFANKYFSEFTGYKNKEVLKKPVNFLKVDDSDIEERKKIRLHLDKKEDVKSLVKNKKKNGEIFYNKIHISPILNKYTNKLNCYFAYQNDITKEYKQQLHYKTILDTSKSIIITTTKKELKTINKRFFDIFGYKDIDDFKSKYKCICELFVQKEARYIMPQMNGKTWLEYIKSESPHEENILYFHKACMIDKNGKERVFQLVKLEKALLLLPKKCEI